ncbi:uncharacterized protein LOC113138034 isoform X2 [Mastacembelus armatus]|uniref:uncharacterized protein LOC113138034 isoform X2 n=1 Tax=Mastacembelus armatus TaxID=205130 RepID=UPI000E45A515|nr:uncharacterized protein LOC113138034 isoform X2 [Mastacembelus armatus]
MACGEVEKLVNDCCRFCCKNMRIHGVITSSVHIFERSKQRKPVVERFANLGLVLRNVKNKSVRMCKVCLNLVGRLERDLTVFKKWQQDEEHIKSGDSITPASSESAAEKRKRLTPSETPRAMKKIRRSPSPQASPRRSVTQAKSPSIAAQACTSVVSGFSMDSVWQWASVLTSMSSSGVQCTGVGTVSASPSQLVPIATGPLSTSFQSPPPAEVSETLCSVASVSRLSDSFHQETQLNSTAASESDDNPEDLNLSQSRTIVNDHLKKIKAEMRRREKRALSSVPSYEKRSSISTTSIGDCVQELTALPSLLPGHVSASEIGEQHQQGGDDDDDDDDDEHLFKTTHMMSEVAWLHDSPDEMEVTIDENEYNIMKNRISNLDGDVENVRETTELRAAGADNSCDEDVYIPLIIQKSSTSELLLECEEEELEPWQKPISPVHLKDEDDVGELRIHYGCSTVNEQH